MNLYKSLQSDEKSMCMKAPLFTLEKLRIRIHETGWL